MKFNINYSYLLRNDLDNLFKWSKYGVIIIPYKLNLNKLSYDDALDALDRLEDNIELTFQKKQDIKEVREYLDEIQDTLSADSNYTSFDF